MCDNVEMALGQTVKILLKNKTKFKKQKAQEKNIQTVKRQVMKYK